MYFGCGIVCCCHNEKYDVCEHASQERARKRSTSGVFAAEGTAEVGNPLERLESSALYSPEAIMTPLAPGGQRRATAAGAEAEAAGAPVVEGIAVAINANGAPCVAAAEAFSTVVVSDQPPQQHQQQRAVVDEEGQVSVFADAHPVSLTEAAVAMTSTPMTVPQNQPSASVETPVTTCFAVPPAAAV